MAMRDQVIAALRRSRCGLAVGGDEALLAAVALRPLHGGGNNAVYCATVAGQPIVLKCYTVDVRQRAQKEQAALLLAAARGCHVAPRLLALSDDAQVPIAALELLPGSHLGGAHLTLPQIAALAAALASLYALADISGVEPTERAAAAYYTVSALPVATGTPYMRAYVGRLAHDADHALQALWQAWQRGPDAALLRMPAPPVFARGDPNLANCLWDGAQVRIVDFEYAGLSDRAFDLADLIEHPQSRATPDAAWAQLLAMFALPAWEQRRVQAAQRLLRLFWALKFRAFGAEDPRLLAQLERMRTHA